MPFDVTPYLAELRVFCRRWRITEMALFGSALRDNFSPDSDIDVLVSFDPEARWTLFDHVQMQDELTELFGRKVDLISKRGIEESRNPYRKNEILATAQVIYAS